MERVKGRFDQGSWFESVTRNSQNKTNDLPKTNQGILDSNKHENKKTFLISFLSWEKIKPTKSKHSPVRVNPAEKLKTSEWLDDFVQPPTAAECSNCQVGRLSGPFRSRRTSFPVYAEQH